MTAYRDRKNAGMYAKPEPPGADDKYDVEPETGHDLDAMSKDELIALAKERGVSPANATMTKNELKAALGG
jgi:hypothetical protein